MLVIYSEGGFSFFFLKEDVIVPKVFFPPHIYLLRKLTKRVKALSPRWDAVHHALYNKRSSGALDARVGAQTCTCEKGEKKKKDSLLFSGSIGKSLCLSGRSAYARGPVRARDT